MKKINTYPSKVKLSGIKRTAVCLILLAGLSACDSIPFIDNTPDYKGAGRVRPLEVPPDLTVSPTSDAYSVPGSTSYSSYSQGQEVQEAPVEKVLATPEGVRLEKAGGQTWLVVNAPVEKIWPVIHSFWTDMGFAVRVENTQLGIMETEWIDAEAINKKEVGDLGDKFDRWLDKLSGFADKKKFRTRLDRGSEANTTEIYMSHRSVSGKPDNLSVEQKPSDAKGGKEADSQYVELDTELLRRLMVKLGVEEKKSQSIVASAAVLQRAEVIKQADGSSTLLLSDPFDRAWRRVGLALDRVGFVIEDKDRSKGIFFVRYADVDIDDTPKEKKGFLDSLKFWGDSKKQEAVVEPKAEDKGMLDKLKFWSVDEKKKTNPEKQYRVKVSDAGQENSTIVAVIDKEGNQVNTSTANRIMALMFEQLK